MSRRHGHTPKFSLHRVQELARAGHPHVRITRSAIAGARALYMTVDEIVECVCTLTPADYQQTLESTVFPGTFQDVYKPRFRWESGS